MTNQELKAFFTSERQRNADKRPEFPNQYKCHLCGDVCELGDDDEALAELQRDFPLASREHCEIICNDCYQKVHPEVCPEQHEQYKAEQN